MTYILVPCAEHTNIQDHKLTMFIKCNKCIAYYECCRCDNMFVTTKTNLKSKLPITFFCATCCNNKQKNIFTSQ